MESTTYATKANILSEIANKKNQVLHVRKADACGSYKGSFDVCNQPVLSW